MELQRFISDAPHLTLGIEREGVHLYVFPFSNDTGPDHVVLRLTSMRTGMLVPQVSRNH